METGIWVQKFKGTGANLTFSLPFAPKCMQFFNSTGQWRMWVDGMPAGSIMRSTGADITSGGITVDGNDVTIGADGEINAAGETFRVVAWGL